MAGTHFGEFKENRVDQRVTGRSHWVAFINFCFLSMEYKPFACVNMQSIVCKC